MGFPITSLDALGGHPVILCPPKCRLVFVVVVVIGELAVLKILVKRSGYMTMWFQNEYVIFLVWFSMYRYVILLDVDGGGGGLWGWWLFWLSFIFYFYFYFGMGIDCGGNGLYSLWLWWLVLIVGEERKSQRGRERNHNGWREKQWGIEIKRVKWIN